MCYLVVINILSALAGLLGGIVLAFSANPILKGITEAIDANRLTGSEAVEKYGPSILIDDLVGISAGAKKTRKRVRLGSVLLMICFTLQVVVAICQQTSAQ